MAFRTVDDIRKEYEHALNAIEIDKALSALCLLGGDLDASEEGIELFSTLDEQTKRGICATKSGFNVLLGTPNISVNVLLAYEFFGIGTDCGNMHSAFELGRLYYIGRNIADFKENIGKYYRTAHSYFMRSLLQGQINSSSFYLGIIELEGCNGIPKNENRAVRFLIDCALRGDEPYKGMSKHELRMLENFAPWWCDIVDPELRLEVHKITLKDLEDIQKEQRFLADWVLKYR